MSKPNAPAKDRAARKSPKWGGTYRGIRLPSMADRSRYTPEEVDAAVKAAIAKNPHVFADKG